LTSIGGWSGTPAAAGSDAAAAAATAAEQHSSRFRIFVDTQLALDAPSKRWGQHKNMASASNGELLFAVLSSSGVDVEDREGCDGHGHGGDSETLAQRQAETEEASSKRVAGAELRDVSCMSTIAAAAAAAAAPAAAAAAAVDSSADTSAGTSAFTSTAPHTPRKISAAHGGDGGNHCSAVVPSDHTQLRHKHQDHQDHQDEQHQLVNPYSPHRSRGNSGLMDNLHMMPSLEVDLPADGRPVKV
jgi:hypothetical protein